MTFRAPPAYAVAAADALLEALSIRYPDEIDIERIAAARGLVALDGVLACEDGHVVRGGAIGIVRFARDPNETARWRFTIAHELAHHLLHSTLDDFERCGGAGGATMKYEVAADAFAAALLMPASMFRAEMPNGPPAWRDVERLAMLFGTSLTSTAIRCVQLSDAPLAVTRAAGGKMLSPSSTRGFALKLPKKGAPLPAGTRAHAIANGEPLDDEPRAVAAASWDAAATVTSVVEHARILEPYGSVISLLSY